MKVILKETGKAALYLKKSKFLIVLPLIIFFLSCSGEAPVVNELWWQLNIENNLQNGETGESLSFFIHGEDGDGQEDLESLYLINDDKQFYWTMESDDWSIKKEQNVTWIGRNGILAPGDGHFPEGNYRVLLIDRGGERAEKTFYLRNTIPDKKEWKKPEVLFDRTTLTVKTDNPLFQIWFYNEEGQFLEKTRTYSPGTYEWNQLSTNITRDAASFALYTEPDSGSWGWISRYFYFPK